MSYGASAALQRAVFQALKDDEALAAFVGDAIYDAAPPGERPETYVTLGPEDVRDRSDKTGSGAQHDFSVQVITSAAGFASAKSAASAVSDALVDRSLEIARGTLVSMAFLRARARRAEDAQIRRIDLWFRARVEDSRSTDSEVI